LKLGFWDIFQQISKWMESLAFQYGYFGIFLVSLIGALSILVPIPYTVIIFTLGGLQKEGVWIFEPFWIAVAAGFGSAFGEVSGYLLGYGGRRVIGEKFRKKIDVLVKVFDREAVLFLRNRRIAVKFGPILVFVFALTPLPDDLLFIPLGVVRYGFLKVLAPTLLGKFLMNLTVAYSGRFSIGIIGYFFGVEGDWVMALISISLALILLIVVYAIMFRVKWEDYLKKYLPKEENSGGEKN